MTPGYSYRLITPNWKEATVILKDLDFDYDSLDKLTLIKLITTIVRAERFNEGFLPKCFSNGTALKILKSLQASRRFFAGNGSFELVL